jgi:hypothetical protein
MPYRIEGNAQIIRIIIFGHFIQPEVVDLGRELAQFEAGFEKAPDRLADLSGVEKSDFETATIERLAAERRIRIYPNNFRSAIVAPNSLHYGLARMFQTLSNNPQIDMRIFKTRAEAEAWLAAQA